MNVPNENQQENNTKLLQMHPLRDDREGNV